MSLIVCVVTCMCSYTCQCPCTCVHACGSHRVTSGVSLNYSIFFMHVFGPLSLYAPRMHRSSWRPEEGVGFLELELGGFVQLFECW